MHRIHHSVIIKERDTNYGTIFSTWDRWLGTLLTGIDRSRIRIGAGAYRNPEKLNLKDLLVMPFTRAIR
jgi:sterol desaturase/sphingolipid hydroxylase (fatty acid hydroxylase superfamily)